MVLVVGFGCGLMCFCYWCVVFVFDVVLALYFLKPFCCFSCGVVFLVSGLCFFNDSKVVVLNVFALMWAVCRCFIVGFAHWCCGVGLVGVFSFCLAAVFRFYGLCVVAVFRFCHVMCKLWLAERTRFAIVCNIGRATLQWLVRDALLLCVASSLY